MHSVDRGRGPFSVVNYAAVLLIGILLYAAWARGGAYPPFQYPLVSMGALLLGTFLLFEGNSGKVLRRKLFRDPVFYLGLLFMTQLILQALNSDYCVMWNKLDSVGMNRLPSNWLPWSPKLKPAVQMLNWFLPAWAVILAARHLFSEKLLTLILRVLVWNAVVIALVGMIQRFFGAEKMLGLWEIPGGSFFATFGYVNHAGAFFYLHAAVAAGLAHQAIKDREPPVRIAIWVASFILCLSGAFGSLSRAAGLAGMVLVVVSFGVFIKWAWKHPRGNSQIINTIGVGCIVALTGLVLYFGSGDGALSQEIEETFSGELMEEAVAGRTMQLPGAWDIALDYPVFGCGGWGYRWIALLYIPVNEWELWRGAGKANVHCDPLQFLCEFGFVGALLMAGSVGWLIFMYSRRWKKEGAASVLSKWIALGLLLVFAHSWVDLPYRCPAILIAWCFLLAALPKLVARSNAWEEYDYE